MSTTEKTNSPVHKVFKFGGASAASIERIQKLPGILRSYSKDNILVVISAMGKTTNALEKVVEAFYGGYREEALQLFQQVKDSHLTTAKYLLVSNYLAAEAQLKDFFTEVEWLLHDKPVRDYDYYYDQAHFLKDFKRFTGLSHHGFYDQPNVFGKLFYKD